MNYKIKMALGFIKLITIIYLELFWRTIIHIIMFKALRKETEFIKHTLMKLS